MDAGLDRLDGLIMEMPFGSLDTSAWIDKIHQGCSMKGDLNICSLAYRGWHPLSKGEVPVASQDHSPTDGYCKEHGKHEIYLSRMTGNQICGSDSRSQLKIWWYTSRCINEIGQMGHQGEQHMDKEDFRNYNGERLFVILFGMSGEKMVTRN